MFNFFGKKKEKVQAAQEKIQLSDERISELRDVIETTTAEIKEIDPADTNKNELLASLHEKLGLAYAELGEDDQALALLEKSLDYKLTIGDGYKKLMSIYNAKRAEAARNGSDAGIEEYMGKMDNMRQIAKKVTISGSK
ncbi:tetratricopeptide repeat protein [uncultured Trichococcus sp.]|uniref:tetratricopeptide repeat protein n=1 Tax=uncultured Trichococcus sp. TaxID=189665 RepID=UPI0029C673C5|nr:tetratricopeptide repeat protein [uncultured Trichococcus sp.]